MLSIVGRAFSHASSIGLSNKDVASSVRSATTTVVAVELKRESNTILSLLPLKGRAIGKNSHILYCVKRLRSSLTMPALHILEYLNRLKTATFSRNKKSLKVSTYFSQGRNTWCIYLFNRTIFSCSKDLPVSILNSFYCFRPFRHSA